MTFGSNGEDFYSKLLINYANAGSVVHSGNQQYKTATGFYMTHLNSGNYTIEVFYKLPVAINLPATKDWQTAILQAIWVQGNEVASDSIKCYPTQTILTNGIP